jgi:hemolysin activation/secretion protein
MNMKVLRLAIFLLSFVLYGYAQDFERVKPKEPTEFKNSRGEIYQPSLSPTDIEERGKLLLPELKGVVLVNRPIDLSSSELNRAIGGVSTINVRVPGTLKQLNGLISHDFIGLPLTKEGMIQLKREIILYYRRQGRPVVTIQVPEQKISSGVLQLVVIEGTLGKVKTTGNKYFKSEMLEEYIRLEEGQAIDSDVLITDLDWINRNPFRQVDLVYGPGEIAGTTDIRLLTTDRRPWRIYVGADNTGFRETDQTRLFTGVNWGNVFGWDQILSLQYTTSPDFHKFWALTGHYTIPLPWRDLLMFYGGYSEVKADLDEHSMDSRGDSSQISGRYNLLLKPRPGYLHDAIFGFDFKRTNNNVLFGGSRIFKQSVNLTQLAFGYNGAYDSTYWKTSLSLELYWSPGRWLSDQSNHDYQQIRPFSKNQYLYGRLTFAPILKLPRDFSFLLTIRGQASTTNLLPSEQYGLGGYNTVRGYEERLVNVDQAFLCSTELRSPPLSFIGKHNFDDVLQFLVFLDYALGRNNRLLEHEPKSLYLLSFGPGVRYDITPYINFRWDFGVQLKKLDSRGFRSHFSLVASY